MKIAIIYVIFIIALFTGCSSSKNTTAYNMHIIHAKAENWSNPPQSGSEIPENGIDLTITVKNWPGECDPLHIVYNNYKSFTATIADSSHNTVTIEARIIRSSSVFEQLSESVDLSNRLIFSTSKGEKEFIEITGWTKK